MVGGGGVSLGGVGRSVDPTTIISLVLENTCSNVLSVQKRKERVEVEVLIHPQELVLYLKTPTPTYRTVRSVYGRRCRSHHKQLVVSLKHLQKCSQCSEAGREGEGGGADTPARTSLVLENTCRNVRSVRGCRSHHNWSCP